MTSGYRAAYWVIVSLMVLAVVVNAANGQITIPGLIGILVVVALVRDAQLRRARHDRILSATGQKGLGLTPPVAGAPSQSAPQVPSSATSPDIAVPTHAVPALSKSDKTASRILGYVFGFFAFIAASYGAQSAIKWYRESTYSGNTPYERALIRSLKAQRGYEQYKSFARPFADSAGAVDAMAMETRRGVTLLGPDDQARRIELLDHQVANASSRDCAIMQRGSPDGGRAVMGIITSMDSVSLDAFTAIVARAFILAQQSPSYRVPPLDQDELVTLLRKAGESVPDADKARYFATLTDINAASDTNVCWLSRVLDRYALSQEAGARASAVRLLTLLGAQEPSQ